MGVGLLEMIAERFFPFRSGHAVQEGTLPGPVSCSALPFPPTPLCRNPSSSAFFLQIPES